MNQNNEGPGSKILKTLHTTVDLCSPRPAGSPSEEKLKEYIIERFSTRNYSIQRNQVSFSKFPKILSEQSSQAICLIILTIASFRIPIIGILLPFALTVIPRMVFHLIQFLPHRMISENILVLNQNTSLSETKLLFTAHMDTARAQSVENQAIKTLLGSFFYTGYMVALASFPRLFLIEIPTIIQLILVGLPLVHAIVIIIYNQFFKYPQKSVYSSGANDNASGVAVLLELAMEEDLQGLPVGYLFTSAEEEGLFGASAFIKQLPHDIRKPVVINVDSIGRGDELGLVSEYGHLWTVRTSQELNRVIHSIDPSLTEIRHYHRAGDYLPFCQAGYKSTSLEAVWRSGTPPEYHTIDDVESNVSGEMMSRAHEILLKTAQQLNERAFKL